MRVRRILIALAAVTTLAACGGSPDAAKDGQKKDDESTLPTVSSGTVLADALTRAHCFREKDGPWQASGTVKNTSTKKLALDVLIHVGPADGEESRAHIRRLGTVKPGKSVDWTADEVADDKEDGPCQMQVRVAD
jgi:hypothetical protein